MRLPFQRKLVVLLIVAAVIGSITSLFVTSNYTGLVSSKYKALSADLRWELTAGEKAIAGYGKTNLDGYSYRVVLGQAVIGEGVNNDFKAQLGYLYMINFRPTFGDNIPAINAKDQPIVTVKHPYTNNTLVCEVNFTEYDVGDTISVHFKWYKNSTAWYNNSEKHIAYQNTSAYVQRYNVQFAPWPDDYQIINVSSRSSTFFSVNTTAQGNIEPEKFNHYDLWICSVRLFDQLAWSWGWVNSTPIMIYNHRPDYNTSKITYFDFPEDTTFTFDLGSYFSDIDHDDLDWYINWTTNIWGYGYIHPSNITFTIYNETNQHPLVGNYPEGYVHIRPHANITGIIDVIFTAVDRNYTDANGYRFLYNDYGHTNTSIFRFNVTQVNDPPWASNVFITPAQPTYVSTLTCMYTYNDIEMHPENKSVTSYRWYKYNLQTGDFEYIPNSNTSTLSPAYFKLDDVIKCGVRVKDIYFDYPDKGGTDKSLWARKYTNSTYVVISLEEETPRQQENIIIAIG
ncbi:MAG: hypothetical protein QW594_03135 [Candidatus Woesearchaeota archaeon]